MIILETGGEGLVARTIDPQEAVALESGLSVAEVVLPKTGPETVGQLGLW